MTDRELMQMALDAMLNFPNDISDEMFESIWSLRARLAQPEREWQGLTDEEIAELWLDTEQRLLMKDFADAIEVKLKEKNGF